MLGLGSVALEIVAFLVVLGPVVVFHEFGHFVVAKLVGVRVEVFSFGFGPRLFGRRIGETDYRVSLVPLGGYVRMAGDGTEERTGSPRDFDSRRSWEKLLIMVAGPVFNVVLAIVLLAACLMAGVEAPAWLEQPVVIEHVQPDSPAERAGIQVGDRVLAVDGRPVADWSRFRDLVLVSPNATLDLSVERAGARIEVPVAIEERTKHAIGWAGMDPCLEVAVLGVNDDSPAAAAGLRAGDVLLEAGGRRLCSTDGLVDALQAAAGRPLPLSVRREGEVLALAVEARLNDTPGRWVIGVSTGLGAGETVVHKLGPVAALKEATVRTWGNVELLGRTIVRLFTWQMSLRSTSGVIEIAGIARETASLGLVPLLQLISFISLSLGIFNLLPIPVLDGGRMAIVLVEAVRGRELRQSTKEWILQAGLVMILALMVAVIYFDIVKKLEP